MAKDVLIEGSLQVLGYLRGTDNTLDFIKRVLF